MDTVDDAVDDAELLAVSDKLVVTDDDTELDSVAETVDTAVALCVVVAVLVSVDEPVVESAKTTEKATDVEEPQLSVAVNV